MLLGVAMLGGALWMVWTRRDSIAGAWSALRSPDPFVVGVLLLSILAHVGLSALLLRLLTSRYGRVGRGEMLALVAATSLLNYLPLRVGTVSRIAYHSAYNGIRAVDSAKVVVQAAALSVLVACMVAAATWAAASWGLSLWPALAAAAAALLPGVMLGRPRIWAAAAYVRFAELLVWSVRYKFAFALIAADIDWTAAMGLACMSTMINMIPFFSNGLGVREWAVGLVTPLLAPASAAMTLELAVTAELVNRDAELVMIAAVGTLGMITIGRRIRLASKE